MLTLLGTAFVAVFILRLARTNVLPPLDLPPQHRGYQALSVQELAATAAKADEATASLANSTVAHGGGVPGPGVRAAFYVPWDEASFSSLREYSNQIDLLFPEWLHVFAGDGRLRAITAEDGLVDVVVDGEAANLDDKVMPLLSAKKAKPQVLPMVSNFDPLLNRWIPEASRFFADARARSRFRQEVLAFVTSDAYAGITLDFEEFPYQANASYLLLVKELAGDLHSRGLSLYVAVPARDEDFPYARVAALSDRVILMNNDEHSPVDAPGPIASQEWFTENIRLLLSKVPREKLISTVGAYGYDWVYPAHGENDLRPANLAEVRSLSAQEAWLSAQEAQASIDFDPPSLNSRFAFLDADGRRHYVWFTDAVSALDQMRSAQELGVNGFALWCLGTEDRSLWSVWQHPEAPGAPDGLRTVFPGPEVERFGKGDILNISARPSPGERTLDLSPDGSMIVGQKFQHLPTPYELSFYGAALGKVAITFDDGPDPDWTPKILDILKREHVPAVFFILGSNAIQSPSLVRRIRDEGHEIGNHTWTHPDISRISRRHVGLELDITERFFAAELGVKPLMFRPPYSVTQDPATADQVLPMEVAQSSGYLSIGNNIDPDDWRPPQRSAEQIVANVIAQLNNGNIILLHDGGGNRTETLRALPMIILELRARGYQMVPVSDLLGKTKAEVMPLVPGSERWLSRLDRLGFWLYGKIYFGVILIFVIGDALMGFRLFTLVGLAAFRRFHRQPASTSPDFNPAVAVLIPAYNEERVIVHTVQSALNSDYANLRVIVVDDGSIDETLETVRSAFAKDARVTVFTQPNRGKAAALNLGLENLTEDIFIGIDADTCVDAEAISLLVRRFADPNVAAIAGNARVGNRVNLWTSWQALEYIVCQNLERSALASLGTVCVVPGAIGAWRVSAVREAGGYSHDTVAEDADLTMTLLRRGHRVDYEDRAVAFTEAPCNPSGLIKQRSRWCFGILQSVWKHRAAMASKGGLGKIGLPNILIFQVLLPLVSPVIDLIFLLGLTNYLLDLKLHIHPEAANYLGLMKLIAMFVSFLALDFIASLLAFALDRGRAGQPRDFSLLAHLWLQRFGYRQILALVIARTVKRAIEGRALSWSKLERTAAVITLAKKKLAPARADAGKAEAA